MDFSLSKRVQKAPKPSNANQSARIVTRGIAGGPVEALYSQKSRVPRNIFGLSGFASRAKMQKSLVKSYGEIKKVPVWKIDKSKEQEIFQRFFPNKTQKPFFRKPDITENLRSWNKEKTGAQGQKKADLIERIEILKKASGI